MHQDCKAAAVAALVLAVTSINCSNTKTESAGAFDKLVEDFVYGSLAFSPVNATANGYHQHNGISMDEALDDWSPAEVEAERKFYAGMESRVAALNQAALDKEQHADISIIRDNINLALLDLNDIQSYRHNPTTYVELAGNALYTPYA